MSNVLQTETTLRAEIKALQVDFSKEDFFRVVVLGPQLMVAVIVLLDSYFEEWADRKGLNKFDSEEMRVFELMSKLGKPDSDRLLIAQALASIFEEQRGANKQALLNFESSFNQLQALIAMRNLLSHEYYIKKTHQKLLKTNAKNALNLLAIFEEQMRNDKLFA